MMTQLLKKCFSHYKLEAGCDEAGRGCLAGPVFAAAVILPDDIDPELAAILNDSKKISSQVRDELRQRIEKEALCWAVAQVDHNKIDKINILNASILAMHQALMKLDVDPEFIIVDGNRFKPFRKIPFECIIKGDGEYISIAAASILAKTHRDEFMRELHDQYPVYGWQSNKGYPTPYHRQAVIDFGMSPFHRRSFKMGIQLKLEY